MYIILPLEGIISRKNDIFNHQKVSGKFVSQPLSQLCTFWVTNKSCFYSCRGGKPSTCSRISVCT